MSKTNCILFGFLIVSMFGNWLLLKAVGDFMEANDELRGRIELLKEVYGKE